MRTIGQLLKTTREKKGFTLDQVEKATKIRLRHLQALEADLYQKLPSATYAKGFIKNYAEFLNLSVDTSLAVFRRDFTENELGKIIPRSVIQPLSNKKLIWTPRATLFTAISIILAIFIGFIIYQYQTLINPRIKITIPAEQEILLGPTVTVSGFADPSSVVSINGQLTTINPDGSFSSNIDLPLGQATITIEATNNQGHSTTITRTVEVRPP